MLGAAGSVAIASHTSRWAAIAASTASRSCASEMRRPVGQADIQPRQRHRLPPRALTSSGCGGRGLHRGVHRCHCRRCPRRAELAGHATIPTWRMTNVVRRCTIMRGRETPVPLGNFFTRPAAMRRRPPSERPSRGRPRHVRVPGPTHFPALLRTGGKATAERTRRPRHVRVSGPALSDPDTRTGGKATAEPTLGDARSRTEFCEVFTQRSHVPYILDRSACRRRRRHPAR